MKDDGFDVLVFLVVAVVDVIVHVVADAIVDVGVVDFVGS